MFLYITRPKMYTSRRVVYLTFLGIPAVNVSFKVYYFDRES